MKVFIAGAKNISALDDAVQQRIASICAKGYDILVGDCSGVDSAVQAFCANHHYPNVTVYASNGIARNNIGLWPIKTVPVNRSVRGFDFYRQKDIAMSKDADCGYMVWDGMSKGTLCNIVSLISQRKLVLVRLVPISKTVRIQTQEELARLIAACPADAKKVYAKLAQQPVQMSLFG